MNRQSKDIGVAISTSMPTLKAGQPAGNEKLAGRRRPRRTLSMGVTVEGWLYICLTLFIGVSSISSGSNLLYLVLSMMLASMLMVGFNARANLRRLTLRRHYPAEFHVGQAVHGEAELRSARRRGYCYAVRVIDQISGPFGARDPHTKTLRMLAVEIPPGGSARMPVMLSLPRRGLYELRGARLVSRFPFGFFELSRPQGEIRKLLVLPRLLPTVALVPHFHWGSGTIESNRKGTGGDIHGIRAYQVGDPARTIHWKHSARGQGLKVKEFEQEEARGYVLMLDLRCPPTPTPALLEHFEKAVSVTASLARMMLRRGASVGLWTSEGNVPVGAGQAHLLRILRALAQVQSAAPDAQLIMPEPQPAHVTQVWIEYQPPDDRAARPGRVVPRQGGHIVLDARRVTTVGASGGESPGL